MRRGDSNLSLSAKDGAKKVIDTKNISSFFNASAAIF